MVNFADQLIERPVDNLLVVDALNVAFRWKHSGKLIFADDYVRTVQSLAKSYNAGTVIITADWGSSKFRRALYPEYKGNRKDAYKDQTEEEKENFELFMREYEHTLRKLSERFLVLRYEGVEADDLAAWLVKHRKRYNFEQVWLISSDKDWDLLIDDDVSRFSTVTRKETTVDTWDYPVSREHYISYKCLMGDSGDNVPGIPGVGPKRAADLIATYGDAMDIYDACPIAGKAKYIENLNANRQQILLNYELMDLPSYCEEAIGFENVKDIEWRLDERLQH